MPNIVSNAALPYAAQRTQSSSTSNTPKLSAAIVAALARNGIVRAGIKEFTSPTHFT